MEGETLSEHSSSQLKHRVEQMATHEEEMSRTMEKCMEQQQQLAQLVEGLGKQLSQLQINPVPNVAGKIFQPPEEARSRDWKGRNTQHCWTVGHNPQGFP